MTTISDRLVARALEAAKAPTYGQAQDAIFQYLKSQGWDLKLGLKIPQATSPNKELRLWFKAQAVYATEDESGRGHHEGGAARTISYDLDIRKMTPEEFLSFVKRRFPERFKF